MKILKLFLRAHEYCFYRIATVFGNKGNPDFFKGILVLAVANGLFLIAVYFSNMEYKFGADYYKYTYKYGEEASVVFELFMLLVYFLLFNGKYNLYKERWQNETKTWKFVNGWLAAIYIIMPLLYMFFGIG